MNCDDHVPRVPSLDDSLVINGDSDVKNWPKIPQYETTQNSINNSVKNGNAAVIRNGKEINTYKWPPLLKKDNAMTENYSNGRSTTNTNGWSNKNNNEWGGKNGTTNGASNGAKEGYEKYTYWPELEDNNLKKLSSSNNNGSLINAKALLGNGNGYPAEHDPLTGVDRDGIDRCRRHCDDEDDEDNASGAHCGLGSCQPKWARSFASTHAFMVVFLLAWILQVSSSSFT